MHIEGEQQDRIIIGKIVLIFEFLRRFQNTTLNFITEVVFNVWQDGK